MNFDDGWRGGGSVQIVFGLVRGLTANAVILFADQRPRPAVLHLQETIIAVRLLVRAADRVVQGRAHALTSLELEPGQTPFHGHHVHVFPADAREKK